MERLIVVSNRVAVPAERKVATGGLATAILAALRESNGIWFGWSGEVLEHEMEPSVFESGGLTYITTALTSQDYYEYYNGFANSTLWPLFHFRLDHMSYDRRSLEGYRRVNAKFADKLLKFIRPGDALWIHDYHLIPMAAALRERGFKGPVGFFLHTPFPPCELLSALPCHEEMVRNLCAYDVVGFQTPRDLSAFHDYIGREACGQVGRDEIINAYGTRVRAVALPISVNPEEFAQMAGSASRSQVAERLKRTFVGQTIIVGVDRLDYSKGLVKRFLAFEQLLKSYPENRQRATLLQIAPLSRVEVSEYATLRRELEETSGRINGQFADFDWMPIRYLTRSIQHRSLSVIFRAAAVGLVTPLRDGMNLVAKEYVAAQDPANPGVLVLSRFAGAAQELTDAIIVNPFDIEGVAEGLQRALTMPLDERKTRWEAMYDMLSRHNLVRWRQRFLELLRQPER